MARCLRCRAGNEWIEGDVKRRTESLEELRQRFEAWHRIAYPLFNPERDTTMKHQLWTAWQVANG